jgi:class 3 adenylate cyclase/tetratricopeptide (TPR) repeat protein
MPMRCSNCKAENPAGKKFCGDCGAALANLCPKCGADNPAGKRFCGECGTALGTSAAAGAAKKPDDRGIRVTEAPAPENLEGERKTVTALFADIKGSTELEQDLDPEEARAIVDPALKLMIEAVQRYDGYVVQSTGDGIFAIFGAPVAHEDHPQRALYAALRMQEELKRYSARLREAGNLPIEARVGVNTGEVVVRSISTGQGQTEYTPIGHTTNLASRMQALAPTGSIALSEQTRKLVEGYFALKPLGPTKVKGVSEPVNVYEVTGLGPLRTRLQRSAGRGLSKFVGREREMETMRNAAELARAGRGQIVAAMAEAGVGKSRLFFEFKAKHQSGWMVLEAFSVSHGKATAYLPVIDLLYEYFGIEAGDDARKRREKITGRIITLDPALEDARPYLFGMLGLAEGADPLAGMDPEIRRRRTYDAIKRMLLRESLNQPLMIIFEDLHWIDDKTQGLLNLFADSIGTSKVLLLVNYRPQYRHDRGSKTYYTQLRLDPLGRESADEMLTALVGDGAEMAPLRHLIIERTEGNPFFMEEIAQTLFEEGVLVREPVVRLAKPLAALKLPTTVQGILAARIDRLPGREKDLLQQLAVIGKEFPLSLVREVVQSSNGDGRLDAMLASLQLAEFIYEQPATSDVEYVFKHALTQEVAYGSVLQERRRELHERIGRAIEQVYSDKLAEHVDPLAHHYGRSANRNKAVEYLGRAAEIAIERSAFAEAIEKFERALAILDEISDPSSRAPMAQRLAIGMAGAAFAGLGQGNARTLAAIAKALQLCPRETFPRERAQALVMNQVSHMLRQEPAQAEATSQELMSIAEELGDNQYLAGALWLRGQMQWASQCFELARESLTRALSFGESYALKLNAALVDPVIGASAFLGMTLSEMGFLDQALEAVTNCKARADRIAFPVEIGFSRQFVSVIRIRRGEYPEAAAEAQEGIRVCTAAGVGPSMVFLRATHGVALTALGRRSEGLADMESAVEQWKRMGAAANMTKWLRAQASLMAGEIEAGLRAVDEAVAARAAAGDRIFEAEFPRIRGDLLMLQNPPDRGEAERLFRDAIETARTSGARLWELRASTRLARLLRDTDRRDEARAMLAEIYNWFTEGFDTADLRDAKALLEELRA